MEVIGPVIIVLALAGIPIVALISTGVRKYREREMHHRERMRALELGIELPPEREDPKPRNGKSNPALHGAIWTGLGIGFLATRGYLGDLEGVNEELLDFTTFLSIWAMPMLFVGIGLLIYAIATRQRNPKTGGTEDGSS